MIRISRGVAIGLSTVVWVACQKKSETPGRTSFFDKSGMDTTVRPGNDFFTYANGNWVKKTKIPEDQTFTPDQRFFLGFAQVWRIKVRDETLRAGISTDPHAPDKFRVNGPLSNFGPFYQAFQIKPGERMYKPEVQQAKVW